MTEEEQLITESLRRAVGALGVAYVVTGEVTVHVFNKQTADYVKDYGYENQVGPLLRRRPIRFCRHSESLELKSIVYMTEYSVSESPQPVERRLF